MQLNGENLVMIEWSKLCLIASRKVRRYTRGEKTVYPDLIVQGAFANEYPVPETILVQSSTELAGFGHVV